MKLKDIQDLSTLFEQLSKQATPHGGVSALFHYNPVPVNEGGRRYTKFKIDQDKVIKTLNLLGPSSVRELAEILKLPEGPLRKVLDAFVISGKVTKVLEERTGAAFGGRTRKMKIWVYTAK